MTVLSLCVTHSRSPSRGRERRPVTNSTRRGNTDPITFIEPPQSERIKLLMQADSQTQMLHKAYYDREFLNHMKSSSFEKMIVGDSEAPSMLMSKVVALIADGEPICIGLMDSNPLFILDPPVMGYYYGREPSGLDHTVQWLEELRVILGTMASNLRTMRDRMEANAA